MILWAILPSQTPSIPSPKEAHDQSSIPHAQQVQIVSKNSGPTVSASEGQLFWSDQSCLVELAAQAQLEFRVVLIFHEF